MATLTGTRIVGQVYGDLTGAVFQPTVVGLYGKPLDSASPGDNQAFVFDIATQKYILRSISNVNVVLYASGNLIGSGTSPEPFLLKDDINLNTVTASFFVGDGSKLTGLTTASIANFSSSVRSLFTSGSNISIIDGVISTDFSAPITSLTVSSGISGTFYGDTSNLTIFTSSINDFTASVRSLFSGIGGIVYDPDYGTISSSVGGGGVNYNQSLNTNDNVTFSSVNSEFTGDLTGTASYSLTASILENFDKQNYLLTASFDSYTGSLTSRFYGTASYALNAESSSFAFNAETASFAFNAETSSFAFNAETASFASNVVTYDQTLNSGSNVSFGTVSASYFAGDGSQITGLNNVGEYAIARNVIYKHPSYTNNFITGTTENSDIYSNALFGYDNELYSSDDSYGNILLAYGNRMYMTGSTYGNIVLQESNNFYGSAFEGNMFNAWSSTFRGSSWYSNYFGGGSHDISGDLEANHIFGNSTIVNAGDVHYNAIFGKENIVTGSGLFRSNVIHGDYNILGDGGPYALYNNIIVGARNTSRWMNVSLFGAYLTSSANYQFIVGTYNRTGSDYQFAIGNGAGNTLRSNIFEAGNGYVKVYGTLSASAYEGIVGGGGQSYDQSLNTTDTVRFANLSITNTSSFSEAAYFSKNVYIAGTASIGVLNYVSSSELQIGEKFITIVSGASSHEELDDSGIKWGTGSVSGETISDGVHAYLKYNWYSGSTKIDRLHVYPGLLASNITGTIISGSFYGDGQNLNNIPVASVNGAATTGSNTFYGRMNLTASGYVDPGSPSSADSIVRFQGYYLPLNKYYGLAISNGISSGVAIDGLTANGNLGGDLSINTWTGPGGNRGTTTIGGSSITLESSLTSNQTGTFNNDFSTAIYTTARHVIGKDVSSSGISTDKLQVYAASANSGAILVPTGSVGILSGNLNVSGTISASNIVVTNTISGTPYDIAGEVSGVIVSGRTVLNFLAPRQFTMTGFISSSGAPSASVQVFVTGVAIANNSYPRIIPANQTVQVRTIAAGTSSYFTILGKLG
jgi:hypothetical protein